MPGAPFCLRKEKNIGTKIIILISHLFVDLSSAKHLVRRICRRSFQTRLPKIVVKMTNNSRQLISWTSEGKEEGKRMRRRTRREGGKAEKERSASNERRYANESFTRHYGELNHLLISRKFLGRGIVKSFDHIRELFSPNSSARHAI